MGRIISVVAWLSFCPLVVTTTFSLLSPYYCLVILPEQNLTTLGSSQQGQGIESKLLLSFLISSGSGTDDALFASSSSASVLDEIPASIDLRKCRLVFISSFCFGSYVSCFNWFGKESRQAKKSQYKTEIARQPDEVRARPLFRLLSRISLSWNTGQQPQ